MRRREAHIGEHVAFGLVHQLGQLLDPRAQLVGDLAPPDSWRSLRRATYPQLIHHPVGHDLNFFFFRLLGRKWLMPRYLARPAAGSSSDGSIRGPPPRPEHR